MASCARQHDSNSHLGQPTTRAMKKSAAAAAAEGAKSEVLLNEAAGSTDVDDAGSDLPTQAFTPGQEKVMQHLWQRATTLADNALAKVSFVYYVMKSQMRLVDSCMHGSRRSSFLNTLIHYFAEFLLFSFAVLFLMFRIRLF